MKKQTLVKNLHIFVFIFLNIAFATLSLHGNNLLYLKGPYTVGTTTVFVHDDNRQDPYRKNHTRIIGIDIWYPLSENSHSIAQEKRYHNNGHAVFEQHIQEDAQGKERLAQNNQRPELFIDALAERDNACLAEKFPAIMLLHGYTMSSANYTSLALSLASHGYCVLALNHPGIAGSAVLEDGSSLLCKAQPNLATFFCYEADIQKVIHDFCENKILPKTLAQWVNKNHIALIGHSMGGALATRLAALNERVALAINMDGPLLGRALFPSFNKPCLFMLAGDFYQEFIKRKELFALAGITEQEFYTAIPSLCRELGNNGYLITFKNARHNSFSDFPLYFTYWEKTQKFSKQEARFWRKHLRIENSFSQTLAYGIIEKIITFCNKYLKQRTDLKTDGFDTEHLFVRFKY